MTLDTLKENAKNTAKKYLSDGKDFTVKKVVENLMDGTLITVSFKSSSGSGETCHIHFGRDGTRFYR